MKRAFPLFFLLCLSPLLAEIKYVTITSRQNLPVITVETIDDFEAIINAYSIPIAYLYFDSTSHEKSTLLVAAEGTYFSLPLEGYKTLSDYRKGTTAKYKNGADYYKAQSLGVTDAAFFYYYSRNHFESLKDAELAYRNGFVFADGKPSLPWNSAPDVARKLFDKNETSLFYDAKTAGYATYNEYIEYVVYKAKGFASKADYQTATAQGFATAKDYYDAQQKQFTSFKAYDEAKKLGLPTNADYTAYNAIIGDIEKLSEEKHIERKAAAILFYVRKLPPSEQSLSVLSKSLRELHDAHGEQIRNALDKYIFEVQPSQVASSSYQSRRLATSSDLFSEQNLEVFFSTVSLDKLGVYNNKTGIFKKK